MGKLVSLSDLEFYVNLLEERREEVITDYDRMVVLLKEEFNIDTTVDQIYKIYEPTLEEDVLDLQIMYKNIME